MAKQISKPVKETKTKKPKVIIGKVAQIEEMITNILKETPMTRKNLAEKCPSEFNSATWNTRISRLKSKGIIYQDETKLLKVKEE